MADFIVTVHKTLVFEILVQAESAEEIDDMEENIFLKVDHQSDDYNSCDYEIIEIEEIVEEDESD